METIKIEKGIPIPEARFNGMTATLRKMKIGDSFVCSKKQRSGVPGTAARLGMKAVTRNDGEGQIRVWRVQ